MTSRRAALCGLFLAAACLAAAGCQSGAVGSPVAAVQPSVTTPPEAAATTSVAAKPIVAIETSVGTIKAELWPDKSPISVDNFLKYVNAGHYDGTIFHRCIRGFMIQCGQFPPGAAGKPDRAPIKNEADNGLRNLRGTLAMARTSEVDGTTAQFFVNTVNNAFLDHSQGNYGYAVFGTVIEGMEIVDAIERAPVAGNPALGRPVNPVTIKSIRILSGVPKPRPE